MMLSSRRHWFGLSGLFALLMLAGFSAPCTGADAVSGQPQPGAKQSVPDLDAQVAYQRAFEATL